MELKKATLRIASSVLALFMLTQCMPMNAFAKKREGTGKAGA